MRTFKRYTLIEYMDKVLRDAYGKVKFSQIHVHHTWQPDHATYHKAKDKESVIRGMYNHHTKSRGFTDIAQHATIDSDGYIWDGRSLLSPPASATNHNDSDNDGIHPFMFEMIGNFDKGCDKLEGPQLATVIGIVRAIVELWKLEEKDIRFHREMAPKTCPGSGIEKEWFLAQVRKPKEPDKLPIIQDRVNVVVDGKPVQGGYLIDNTTYVPLREVAEALGATVGWDGKSKTASIKGGK